MPIKHRGKIKERRRMFIHWKSLLAFGILFWFLLCAFDLFGGNPRGYIYDNKDYELLYETLYMEKLKNDEINKNFIPKLKNFGFALLVWNSVTFVCSVLFCYVVRTFWWIYAKSFSEKRSSMILSELALASTGLQSNRNSKIPIKVLPNALTIQSSDSQLKLSKSNLVSTDLSCSNLTERTSANLSEETSNKNSPKCQTIFKNNKAFVPPTKDESGKIETYVDNNQTNKMRQEIIRIQNESLKEQSELSKKLNMLNKEKKELSKQLATAQKENRAAKQQIDELAQDKMILVKKLETVNKEVKSNTKSKKVALARLEELSNNSDNLKQELVQVTRDKEILENKLKVLQEEYARLQERIILSDDICTNYQENTPERDTNTMFDVNSKPILKNLEHPQSVSDSDLDMKKIQVKIKQLERNLENFNSDKTDLNFGLGNGENVESDVSLSIDEASQTEFQKGDEDFDAYEFYFPSSGSFSSSPRFPYWSTRIGPYARSHSNQASSKIPTKSRRTPPNDWMKEENAFQTERDEYSSSQGSLEDGKLPSRAVSSSSAFQRFLKDNELDNDSCSDIGL